MRIRPAIPSDVARLAVLTVASLDDDDMDMYLYPGREKHPEAYLRAYEWRIRMFLSYPNYFIMVAATEESDDIWSGESEIAGYCSWSREGKSKETKAKWWTKETLWQKFMRRVHNSFLFECYHALRNPSISVVHWYKYGSFGENYFDPADKDPDDFWSIADIIVDSKFQRRGIGQLLLKWGFEQATEEKLCISIVAATAGEPLYRKTGFRHIGDWKWGPGEGMESKMLRWDPPGS